MGTPEAIRANRVKLGLTQAQLAREIGVDTRQINRYEIGETEPTLAIARRLADRLRITMDELAGGLSPLNGTWHSAWHNLDPGGSPDLRSGSVELVQQGHHLTIQPVRSRSASRAVSAGTPDAPDVDTAVDVVTDLAWSAEAFVDVDTILGGYKIDTPALRSRGLLNLTHHGDAIDGTWVRIHLTSSSTGQLVLARDAESALTRLRQLLDND
ncbi:helix-turn-helix transcriptional regulator [Microlunatus flavus]|uniref:DNA-binding transcriptional regulator, XRE-family HTH domain n=1 Tax=Microlunatus flavus TaxID=1036181 RepID=A0A1H9MVA5_9ACTN|nr:helix-turn-helix transcriptional regulator [Microlunatus flavus]SER27345.1 DNA-binding transcriptional regulator, XRE-family HTH domain [Microlunatus flavus]